MKGIDYVGGYTLAVLPIVVIQIALFFLLAVILGLEITISVLFAALAAIPMSVLFVALGILIGSVTPISFSAGVSSVIVQLVAFTSGMHFSSDMLGGFFNTLCKVLPFSHAVDILKYVLNGNEAELVLNIPVLLGYTLLLSVAALLLFPRRMQA